MKSKTTHPTQTARKTRPFLSRRYWLPVTALLVALTCTLVQAGPFHHRHGMQHAIEHLLDHLDLNASQEQAIEEALEVYSLDNHEGKGRKLMHDLVQLDPEQAGYLDTVSQMTDEASAKLKEQVLAMAKTRQAIYAVLDAEQKETLNQLIAKKARHMGKRRWH